MSSKSQQYTGRLYTQAEVDRLVREARIDELEWVYSEPTGVQTMTIEQMRNTPDEKWRDEVIQYFFNTESLRMNIDRRITDIKQELSKEDV